MHPQSVCFVVIIRVQVVFKSKIPIVILLSSIVRFIRNFGLPTCLVCVLASCGGRVPNDVVPPEKMANVLFDVHVADGILATQPVDSARLKMPGLYQAIFDRHGIDSAKLQHSVAYYATQPVLMKDMYLQIEDRMNKLLDAEQAALNEHYRLQRQADSIKTARLSDSLRRVEMFRLDATRMRYLLFVPNEADTARGKAIPVTPKSLREQLFEDIRFGEVYRMALYSVLGDPQAVFAPSADSTGMPVPETPELPSTPEDFNPSPNRRLSPPDTSNDLSPKRIR